MSTRRDPLAWIAARRLDGLLLAQAQLSQPHAVVMALTAMQAQDHGSARWSVAQRAASPSAAAVDASFNDGRILRTHVLRPTWHYVSPADLGWLIRLSGPRVQRFNASKYRQLGLDAATLNRGAELIAAAVAGAPRTRRELTAELEQQGISTGGERGSYLLMHAELSAAICSGPMRGRQHTYASFDERVPASPPLDDDEALARLAWRYFSTRGPATSIDLRWWSGLSADHARQGLDAVRDRLEQLTLEGQVHWFAGSADPPASRRQVDLVACYDEIVVSYRHPRAALRNLRAALNPLQAIDGFRHPILLDGQIVGHWRPGPDPVGRPIETRTAVTTSQSSLERASERFRRFITS